MQAWLMSKELWMIVDNQELSPSDTDTEAKLKWQKRAQKAAGELFLSVEQDQNVGLSDKTLLLHVFRIL